MPGGKPIKKPVSQAQQRFFGAELGRARRGQQTQTGISDKELAVKAATPKGKKLPPKTGRGQSMAAGPIAPAPVPQRRGVPAATAPTTLRGRPAPAVARKPGGLPKGRGAAPPPGAAANVGRPAVGTPFRRRGAPPPPTR